MGTIPLRDALLQHTSPVWGIDAVVRLLRAEPEGHRLIGVDGFKGHGKSYVARQIAAELGLGYIEADAFPDLVALSTPRNPILRYVEVLDLERIRGAVDAAVSIHGGAVLDSVCNLELCRAIDRPRTFGVYVLGGRPIPVAGEAVAPTCALYLHEYHDRFNAVAAADVLLHNPWPVLPGETLDLP